MIDDHSVYILGTGKGQTLDRSKLGMGMEIANDLDAVQTGKNWVYLLMIPVMGDYALWFSAGGLKTKGMLYDKPVFESIPQQEAEALFLIDLRRTQQQTDEGMFRQIYSHPFHLRLAAALP